MITRTVSDWMRRHIFYMAEENTCCVSMIAVSAEEIETHVEERTAKWFEMLRARCAMGFIRYENTRGRAPNYLAWLEQSLARYKESGNIDDLYSVAFYALAESDNPSKEGAHYETHRDERGEL